MWDRWTVKKKTVFRDVFSKWERCLESQKTRRLRVLRRLDKKLQTAGHMFEGLHPRKITWNLKIPPLQRKKTSTNHRFWGFVVSFRECTLNFRGIAVCILGGVVFFSTASKHFQHHHHPRVFRGVMSKFKQSWSSWESKGTPPNATPPGNWALIRPY